MVIGPELDDWCSISGIFPRHLVQTSAGVHPVFCPMDTGGAVSGAKGPDPNSDR